MKRNSPALLGIALAAGLAAGPVPAQDALDRIVVRPTSGNEMTFECGNLFQPKPIDVEALLKINDRTQTQHLSNKLVGAMAEACSAGIPTILVERGKDGRSLVWYPVAPVVGYPVAPVYVEPVVEYVEPPAVYVEPRVVEYVEPYEDD
jgi:hypothetical protein